MWKEDQRQCAAQNDRCKEQEVDEPTTFPCADIHDSHVMPENECS